MKRLTTVTASLSRDSPKTMMKSVSLTCTSSKTANTATGSTAEIRLPKSKKSSKPACTLGAYEKQTGQSPLRGGISWDPDSAPLFKPRSLSGYEREESAGL